MFGYVTMLILSELILAKCKLKVIYVIGVRTVNFSVKINSRIRNYNF